MQVPQRRQPTDGAAGAAGTGAGRERGARQNSEQFDGGLYRRPMPAVGIAK
jgi:hypothetical protein